MMATHSPFRVRVAVLTIISFLGTPIAQLAGQTAAAPKVATGAKPAPPAPDGGWPRSYATASSAALVIYQPQISTWAEQKHAVMFAAVSYTVKGAKDAALGTIKVESDTSVALDERLVSFSDMKITESKFPTLQRDQLQAVVKEITASVSLADRVIGLDRVLASLDTSQIIPKNVDGVKADPPPIFFSKTSAMLVNIDGDPIWSPIPNNDLQSAVNTNWDLFQHTPTNTYFLRNEKVWLKATAVKGPWVPAGTLPESFKKLPSDDNWKEVRASLPGAKMTNAPAVFVSTVPAEMILLKGEPTYATVTGAQQLLWVSNTDSDIFRMGRTGAVYFLVSGRWFSAPDFTGPWTFATPKLPEDFKKIPLEHERSRVLASVPGTTQAAEAILLAQIPQTATVSKTLAAPAVAYQGGTPQFQPIETTTVQRAVNTDKDIFKVGDLYYLCFQGVWFMSTTPAGPWKVTGDVPKAIYTIPVSSSSYSVTYVTVQQTNTDAVVFATALAFTGVMVAWGCVVWGTGYHYPPYVYRGGMYPIYYPHYPSYGFGAAYNPWTGAYTRGAVAYGPYGGAGAAQRYNPQTGTYSRGAVAYGPYGAKGAASAYNPRTGTAAATRQGSNVYGSWGQTGVARGDQWATTSHYTNNMTGTTTRTAQTSGGGAAVSMTGPGGNSAAIGKTAGGDVYAGKDGNVYKKSGDGYQQYGSGGWSSVDSASSQRTQTGNQATGGGAAARTGTTPTTSTAKPPMDPSTTSQLNKDSAARAEGAKRTSDLGSVRSGSTARTSSYRPTGAARSGGGRGR